MTAFAGLRGTGSWGTDERPKNFREMILWANPNGGAPLLALMSKMKKESTTDPEFKWWTEQLQNVRVQLSAYNTGYATTDTTFNIVQDGFKLVPGDVLQVEVAEATSYATEFVRVSAVTSDTVIVVIRGNQGTTATGIPNTQIASGQYMTKMGNAQMEGTTSPSISQRNPTEFNNYTQIFKTAVGITETAKNTKTRTGDGYLNDKKRKMFDHSTGIEWAFLYGVKSEDLTGAFPLRYTGGVRQFLSTNVTIFATTPTVDTFLGAVYPVFNYERGSQAGNERIVFAGNGFLNTLNQIIRKETSSRVVFNNVVDFYGMKLQRFILPQGVIYVKTHPLMNIHPRYTNSAFILDPTSIVYRPLRDTRFQDNIQANDSDSRKGQWLSEVGLELQHEYVHGYIGNFTNP